MELLSWFSYEQEVVPGSVLEDEVGIDVHTTEVKPYKLDNGLILVDFPGSNGVSGHFDRCFAAFTAMPSIIVLLLNFEVCQLYLLLQTSRDRGSMSLQRR